MSESLTQDAWCQLCGYSPEWLVAGMLDVDFVQMQAIEYQQDADADLADYKRDAYRYLLAKINWRDRSQFRQFMQVVESDAKMPLSQAAISELIESDKVPYDWFAELADKRVLQQASIQQKLAKIKP
ncbi:hypothetical protein IQ266_21865 [filamentous cyanobacterium LEGE 11480]|uniref:Uncharacterized protein n=1 Tax=Romeriopsis navalis LEGE 11480 TaxID=2777977 RepID=A0A928Z534_9CYAN|nr:hypothetical protein [Romeriopsis navalis]MBE9032389.1 hypothetical protein [Romeriopsis navalis LEGE 11480]